MMNLQENARELAAKPGNFKDWWFEDMGKSSGKAMEAKRGRTVEQRVMDRGKLKKQSQHQWHRKTGWQAIRVHCSLLNGIRQVLSLKYKCLLSHTFFKSSTKFIFLRYIKVIPQKALVSFNLL